MTTVDSVDSVDSGSLDHLGPEAEKIIARYPRSRSALLPMLHLVQSEQGYVSPDGIEFCAAQLGLTTAQVEAVASFYTMFARREVGEHLVAVCTNTLCAVMGGDLIHAALARHLDLAADEHGATTADAAITLDRVECNAACDHAPVIMVNWEFFDNMTPEKARALVDDLRSGTPVWPSRGTGPLCNFRETARLLAGTDESFADDERTLDGPALAGVHAARKHGWTAPDEPEPGALA